jgi:hypothetical protein
MCIDLGLCGWLNKTIFACLPSYPADLDAQPTPLCMTRNKVKLDSAEEFTV